MTIEEMFISGGNIIVTLNGMSKCKDFLKSSKELMRMRWLAALDDPRYIERERYEWYHVYISEGRIMKIVNSPYGDLESVGSFNGYQVITYDEIEGFAERKINVEAWLQIMK